MSQTLSQRADALEQQQLDALAGRTVTKSQLFHLADGYQTPPDAPSMGTGRVLMGTDPRLPEMPEKPNLLDFFRYRFGPGQQHVLQSARLAKNNGLPEHMIMACLVHDIGVIGFIRSDHGYWGEQLLAPYVTEEIAWAIRLHQVLRFYPDESVGYEYPEAYIRLFGEGYQPEPYIQAEYERAKDHKWYMSARMICLNDLYSFDDKVHVEIEEFEDIVGRNFKQPPEGLGNDNTPSSHMWRTLIRPANAL